MTEFSFESLSEESKRKIQQIQIYEQNLQQVLMEKRALLLEIEELENALKELEKTNDDIFKILAGQYIVKKDKKNLFEEINHKKEIFSLRIKNLEKQEKKYINESENLRKEVIDEINNTKI